MTYRAAIAAKNPGAHPVVLLKNYGYRRRISEDSELVKLIKFSSLWLLKTVLNTQKGARAPEF